jgi:hypothetical protein
MNLKHALALLLSTLILTACNTPVEQPVMIVSLLVDGRALTYDVPEPITVSEFLADVGVTLGDLDVVSPPAFTQVSDGIQVTVRRVVEENSCEDSDIPFQRRQITDERLAPGAEVQFQPGTNGRERRCFRVQIVDGLRGEMIPVGQSTVLTAPVDEIVYVGPISTLDRVDVRGTLAYITSGNAWVMRGSSDTRAPVTNTGDLDPLRAFALSPDGRQLLVTRITTDDGSFGNQLFLVPDIGIPSPPLLPLLPSNILWADWVPNQQNTISYTRAEPRPTSPGWGAYNDLWFITIDAATGEQISITPIIEESSGRGGPFSWWGRQYKWSPDGSQLAWIHADGIGTIDLATGQLNPALLSYDVFSPRSDWSWRSTVGWSADSSLITTVVHGAPIGSESADRSPVFDVAVASADGAFASTVLSQSGIWALPQFSPIINGNQPFPTVYLAYLRARQPLVSVGDSSEYDLVIADSDGSNARVLFPPEGQRGLTQRDFTWNPEGTHIAVVYQGNLWVIDVVSGVANQVTLDGNVSRPVWTR